MTLEGHKPVTPLFPGGKLKHTKMNHVSSICYFPDGKQLISGSDDKTARQWDLQARKEMNEAQDVREQEVCVVGVSRDGRWVVTAEGTFGFHRGELRICEVETGIIKSFSDGHIGTVSIDISLDSTLLASASSDGTVTHSVGAIRLSQDSKKLAIKSAAAQSLEVWDIEVETCVRMGPLRDNDKYRIHVAEERDTKIYSADIMNLETGRSVFETSPIDQVGVVRFSHDSTKLAVMSITTQWLEYGILRRRSLFWTIKDKSVILGVFNFKDDELKTMYEFDASTLQTVRAPFKGHTNIIHGLALPYDSA
ncbi:WD40-repeat-containing domain protein [Suillus subaureus]|uniref:WD40-repeat-containing domain protein n=1 Tax=Suillus subaureus TaxID=48587 RepID=A0A9P7EAZ8_9AGAM|nr:WD40-repeat-containing domain protein [Suillus subaureus]KAG1815674.1 WD40-repeat-containing domain protein [Suillus subaureus]